MQDGLYPTLHEQQDDSMVSRRLALTPILFWRDDEGIAITEYGLLIKITTF
jgi:hypothetical protein